MKSPSRLHQYLASFSGLLALLNGGMLNAWPSPSLPQLLNNSSSTSFHITSNEGSSIAIMQLLGNMSSCAFAIFLLDLFGRKKTMLLAAVPLFIGWLMTAFASSVLTLCLARYIAGLGEGLGFIVMPLYIGEIADPEIRGFLGTLITVLWIIGLLAMNIVGSYWSIKITALASSVVPLLVILTFVWMPESPYWLIMKQDFRQAEEALIKFKGTQIVQNELERLKIAVKSQMENKRSYLKLFLVKESRKPLITIVVLMCTEQISGMSAIIFYAQIIFQEAGASFISPSNATVILTVFQLIAAIASSVIVDKTGRKILLSVSIGGSALTLFICGTYFYLKSSTNLDLSSFSFIPLASLVGFIIIFGIGGQTIPLLMLGELFPTNMKVFASCLNQVVFGISASVVSKFFQVMNDTYGMFLPFYVFGVCSLGSLILIYFFVPETKGKTLEEIQEGFK